MAAVSIYLADKLLDHSNGVASYTMPTVYVGLFMANAGQSPRSTAVAVGQTTVPAAPNGHMYRCTAAGTTGASEPTWGTTSGGTTTDGGATWAEMTPDFQANNGNLVEANYTGYARAALSGLMGSAASGTASNSGVITYGQDTAGTNVIAGWASFDALTSGNLLKFAIVSTPESPLIVNPNITPDFPVGKLTTSLS